MGYGSGQSSGDALLAAAAAASIAIAQGKTSDEIEVLAAFFNVLGDNLELLAIHAPDASPPQTYTS